MEEVYALNLTLDDFSLDLGDVGQMPCVIDGFVAESGLFGNGKGYLQSVIQKVVLHIEYAEIDVTHLLCKAAKASICEALEKKYESCRDLMEGA